MNIPEIFGSMVFNDKVMQERLPKKTYDSIRKSMAFHKELDLSIANEVASAMKDWAIEKGATHFTHWFQPMTGFTAEKHDSFIFPANGGIIMEFSGKELIKGESDASSLPSGGLRTTFEARGYTAWDPTSYAFVKDDCLYIPTAFCSYGGEALDKKTPLLRSMEALSKQTMRVLKLFGNNDVTSVTTTVGPEQEYFLIDKLLYEKRKDLIFTGRTLFGAKAPKGQEMEDHYYGAIKQNVLEFMKDLDTELWKLGVYAKTEHNEAAPSQHELAPVYAVTNISADHNQLTMELMKKIALKHNMVCLLHEKPFSGINGSGKHNNWSISTNTGVNLFEPGDTPMDNAQFLLFLSAVIKAVDEYQDLLRISVASAGNDHRLGANEAPPAVISIFLGEEIESILNNIENGTTCDKTKRQALTIGVDVLPKFAKDTTDRNRTSPFAFTGNKFEFRMLGSSESIACTNIMLNTAVAEELSLFADRLEKSKNFKEDLNTLIKEVIRDHKRILFNGNGYDENWLKEAEKRGLSNYRTTPECMPHYLDKKNVALLSKHKVLSETEIKARYEIIIENYCKTINIEALTMLSMVKKDILPAVSTYAGELANIIDSKNCCGAKVECKYEKKTIAEIDKLSSSLFYETERLEKLLNDAKDIKDVQKLAIFYKDEVISAMAKVREYADKLEEITAKDYWPFPTYADLLFSI